VTLLISITSATTARDHLLKPSRGCNTLSRQMALDILAAAPAARDDEAVRAVVFRRAGPCSVLAVT
jgi:enoyl-CoA hydratase/carnithine racemase